MFCSIVAGDLPSRKVHEDERVLAFMDINPISDGHLLVIPKAHARDLHDVPAEDLAACALVAQQLATRAVDRLGADGVNLLQCSGEAAFQTVFHVHLHVTRATRAIPRATGSASSGRPSTPPATRTGSPRWPPGWPEHATRPSRAQQRPTYDRSGALLACRPSGAGGPSDVGGGRLGSVR